MQGTIELRPHIQVVLRTLEMEHGQLAQRQQEIVARMQELNAAFLAMIGDALPAGATLDGYELVRDAHNAAVGLRPKPLPGTNTPPPVSPVLPPRAESSISQSDDRVDSPN